MGYMRNESDIEEYYYYYYYYKNDSQYGCPCNTCEWNNTCDISEMLSCSEYQNYVRGG